MLLREISPSDPVTNLVLQGFEKSAPILKEAQFYAKNGAADSKKRAKATSEKTDLFRALNADNTASTYTPTYDTVTKKIVSFDVSVDVTLEDRNEDPLAELAQETINQSESFGYLLQEELFKADTDDDSQEFNGMEAICEDRSLQETVNDGSGLVLLMGNSDTVVAEQQKAIELLLRLFASVRGGASHAYMNEYLKIRWLTIAKNLGYYRQSKDELGNMIEMIGDTVIRGAGYNEPGSPLLPFTETPGGGSSSSIFCVRWGEGKDLTILTSVGIKGRYAGQSGNFLINNVNMDAALHLQNNTAMKQSRGWKLG